MDAGVVQSRKFIQALAMSVYQVAFYCNFIEH